MNLLLDLHWNEEQNMYCDLDINDDGETTSLLLLMLSVLTGER
jgi:hypothetical protein